MIRYFHPKPRQEIENLHCDACQKYKVDSWNYGLLPPRDVQIAPWEQVAVDLIVTWTVQTRTGRIYGFSALTSIDRVTGLAELIRIDNKTSDHIVAKFMESWLSRLDITQDPSHVATTMGASLLVGNFRKLCQTLESKMYLLLAEIPPWMMCANKCTR